MSYHRVTGDFPANGDNNQAGAAVTEGMMK